MPNALVIVESPAKAKTIKKYLGKGYSVMASVGHVVDLPQRDLGVDIDNGFAPKYVVIRGKAKVLKKITGTLLPVPPTRGYASALSLVMVDSRLGWIWAQMRIFIWRGCNGCQTAV